ncbi:chaperonin 10-like protein [Leptodontidium sp. MPI-SDFR-AT-0119]|nr:chaperonin 10-like protein [Leptodontidium sp. MPI-SDFR-AT-0119]
MARVIDEFLEDLAINLDCDEEAAFTKTEEKEILVKVHATALNPIDCKFIDFIAPSDNLLGCEFAGVVADVVAGSAASRTWKIGDCVAGFVQGGVSQERGAFAEYVKAEDDLVWRIPAGVKDGVLPGTTRLWRMDWRRTHISRSWMGFNVSTVQSDSNF